MRHMREGLFRWVCLTASVLLLVLSLMNAMRMTGLNDRAAQLEAEMGALEQENRVLRARSTRSLPLDTLEELAIREYGMQVPAPSVQRCTLNSHKLPLHGIRKSAFPCAFSYACRCLRFRLQYRY